MSYMKGTLALVAAGIVLGALVLIWAIAGDGGAECAVDPATLTADGCVAVMADDSSMADPEALWGVIACAADERHRRLSRGGDLHRRASGADPSERSYRVLSIQEGDDSSGQRCELGRNEHRFGDGGGEGTFQLYGEGERRITFISYKLLSGTPIDTKLNYAVLQMKQTQPSENGDHSPMVRLTLDAGDWVLKVQDSAGFGGDSRALDLWRVPAQRGVWTRVAIDATYSQSPGEGRLRIFIDSDGDGDALDSGERSPTFETAILRYETSDPDGAEEGDDGIAPGESIPSHLRVGLYQDPRLDCARAGKPGCEIAIDSAEVLAPP